MYFLQRSSKDHNHLFFNCKFTSRLLKEVMAKCFILWSPKPWSQTIHWVSSNWKGKLPGAIVKKLLLAAYIYSIWIGRNSKSLNNVARSANSIVNSIFVAVRIKLQTLSVKPSNDAFLTQRVWQLQDSFVRSNISGSL